MRDKHEFMAVRFAAVTAIVSKEHLLPEDGVKQIKGLVTDLEQSSSKDDRRIASRLRQVAEAMESRMAETRRFE